MPKPYFLHIIFTYLLLLGISTISLAQKPIDQQIAELQAQVGDKLTMVADGLELYNLAKDGDLNQAALYFKKKTGIHIYPAFLFRTKIAQLNTFFDDYNRARFNQLPEPYIILLFTITDTTAAFQYDLSPTLLAKKAKLDALLQSKAGGFAQRGSKRKFLLGMPALSLNLRELADLMVLDGLVDQLGMLAGDLEALVKKIVLQIKTDKNGLLDKEKADRDSIWKEIAIKRSVLFGSDKNEKQDTALNFNSELGEVEGMVNEADEVEFDTSKIQDPDIVYLIVREDKHQEHKLDISKIEGAIFKLIALLDTQKITLLVAELSQSKELFALFADIAQGNTAKAEVVIRTEIDKIIDSN